MSWAAYAAATAVVVAVLATGVVILVDSADGAGVWLAAGVAYVVQLAAFAGLLAVRKKYQLFLVGWAGGMALRFVAIAGLAVWVTRSSELDPASVLVSVVGFVMVLVLLEPLFLRLAD